MSEMLRNLKVGRAILNARITKQSRLVLLIDTGDSCTVRSLDYETQKPIEGFKVAVETKNKFAFVSTDDALFVYNHTAKHIETHLYSNQQLAHTVSIADHLQKVTAFKASHNGYYVAAGDSSGAVSIWHPKIDTPKRVVKSLGSQIVSLVFDTDNKQLAIATALGEVVVVEIGDQSKKWEIFCGEKASKMAFVGGYLIIGDKDGLIRIFERKEYKEVAIKSLDCGEIVSIESCFGGKGIVVASKTGRLIVVSLVDLTKNELLLDVCNDELTSAPYDDETKRLVLVSSSGNIYYYDLSQDRELEYFFKPKEEEPKEEKKSKKENIKVLSVDDSVTMRRVIVSAVKNCTKDAITYEAGDGKEALKVLRENPDIDVMFLDWNMPTMSGEEVAQTIKNAGLYPDMQIIMATTEGGKDKVTKMLRLGVAGYLVKPFRPDAITKIMSKLVEQIRG